MSVSLRLLLLLWSLLAAEAMVGRCGHDEMQSDNLPRGHIVRGSASSLSAYSRGGAWEPIRISVYYGKLNMTTTMKSRLTDAVSGAVNWLQRTLKVQPITTPFRFKAYRCASNNVTGDILKDWINADFALYVIGDMDDNGVAGYATACQLDDQTDQPVAGLFYLNAKAHDNMQDERILSTAIHELVHALGFSNYLFKYYRKENGNRYSNSELFVQEELRGYNVSKLALPTLTEMARKAFNCSSLNGVELERDGGQGTKGSHWEKRVMNNDFMVADDEIFDVTYSDITMAVFQDSGWYQVSYKYTNQIQWGLHKGCEFLSKKCVVDGQAISSEFCVAKDEIGCDFLNLRKSYNSLYQFSKELPPEYQYFSSPFLGGSDRYLDRCPIMAPFIDGDCRDPRTLWMREEDGEAAGLQSRCVSWDVGNVRLYPGCHLVNCEEAEPIVTVGDTDWRCPVEGGWIEIGQKKLSCPPREQLCRDVPCVNNCYGFGVCKKGFCECEDGTDRCNYEYGYFANGVEIAMAIGPLILVW